ncbi:MAG: type II secretion system protein [candidate division WOR-3 bacterium]
MSIKMGKNSPHFGLEDKVKLQKREKRGFTLIELLVVIVILAVLLSIVIPNYILWRRRAKEAAVKANMHIVHVAMESYAVDHCGYYPNEDVNWTPVEHPTFKDMEYYFPASQFPTNPYTEELYNSSGVEEDLTYEINHLFPTPEDAENIDNVRSDDPKCPYKGLVHPANERGAIAVEAHNPNVVSVEPLPGPDYKIVTDYAVVGWGQNPNQPIHIPKGNVDIYFVLFNKGAKPDKDK